MYSSFAKDQSMKLYYEKIKWNKDNWDTLIDKNNQNMYSINFSTKSENSNPIEICLFDVFCINQFSCQLVIGTLVCSIEVMEIQVPLAQNPILSRYKEEKQNNYGMVWYWMSETKRC